MDSLKRNDTISKIQNLKLYSFVPLVLSSAAAAQLLLWRRLRDGAPFAPLVLPLAAFALYSLSCKVYKTKNNNVANPNSSLSYTVLAP